MQRLFTTARWDEDLARDGLRGYVTAALAEGAARLAARLKAVKAKLRWFGYRASTRRRPRRPRS
jgi:hypothetical protein